MRDLKLALCDDTYTLDEFVTAGWVLRGKRTGALLVNDAGQTFHSPEAAFLWARKHGLSVVSE